MFVDFTESGYKTYNEKFSTDIYFSPWSRICVYIVGLFAGYILNINKGKVKMPKVIIFVFIRQFVLYISLKSTKLPSRIYKYFNKLCKQKSCYLFDLQLQKKVVILKRIDSLYKYFIIFKDENTRK